MNKFNPTLAELSLVDLIVRKAIFMNIDGIIDVNLEIDEQGLRLFAILPNEPQISWNRCEAASTEEELRNMGDWLLEQEMKAIETKQ
jgi:hypothetical protein